MKKVLVIDESNLFRDFLKQKLEEFGLEVVVAVNGLDGTAKMHHEMPDLIIMDYYLSRTSSLELLQKKKADPNIAMIPVIMASTKIDKKILVEIAQYNVKKFFTKPIRVDALVKTVSEVLKIQLSIDTTPSIIEAHVNDQIVFIEVAQGLNKEKIELLKYKIIELLELYEVKVPRALIIMSNIDVGAEDLVKLNALFSNVLEHTGALPRHVKVLTNSEVIKKFIESRSDFAEIEVTDSLEAAMDGLLGKKAGDFMDQESHTVGQEFLQASSPKDGKEESIDIKFQDDAKAAFDLDSMGDAATIAIVDDDFVIREMVKAVLSDTSFTILEYEHGGKFLESEEAREADLVFLDLMMPEVDGFQVMAEMEKQKRKTPIIVLSALSQRETVVKAMKYGVISYIIKPLEPESILNKAREVLKTNF